MWDPPARVVFTWHPGHPADEAQQVELVFASAGDSATEVVLTHTGWERRRDGAAARALYDGGWDTVLGRAYRESADTSDAHVAQTALSCRRHASAAYLRSVYDASPDTGIRRQTGAHACENKLVGGRRTGLGSMGVGTLPTGR